MSNIKWSLPFAFLFLGAFVLPMSGQRPVNLINVTVSTTFATLRCPPGCMSRSGDCGSAKAIKVHSGISGPGTAPAELRYRVTGGRIVGFDNDVVWDLSTVPVGDYAITASTNNATSKPVYVNVRNCPDCLCDIDCPTLTLKGPTASVKTSEILEFVAEMFGGGSVAFLWKVNGGKIVSGRFTNNIQVKATRKYPGKVIVSVELESKDLREGNCLRNASAEVDVRPN